MNRISRPAWALALSLYAFLAVIMPMGGCDYDLRCWADWASYIHQHGLGSAYGSGTNYLPGHLYELRLFAWFFDSSESVAAHIGRIKRITLLFDVAGALLVASLAKQPLQQCIALAALLLNPAYLHNTVIWGQFDTVFSVLVFAAFLAAVRGQSFAASVLYLLALNFKLQAIIFFPPFALLLFLRAERVHARSFAWGAVRLLALQALILLPFFLKGQASDVFTTAIGLGGSFGPVALNAANV